MSFWLTSQKGAFETLTSHMTTRCSVGTARAGTRARGSQRANGIPRRGRNEHKHETDLWVYSGTGWGDALDITGYKVEALDGSIGKVDRADIPDERQLHRRGHRALDLRQEGRTPCRGLAQHRPATRWTVFVHRTKDEIKDPPEYDDTRFDEAYRNDLGAYYGPGGRGYRERPVR